MNSEHWGTLSDSTEEYTLNLGSCYLNTCDLPSAALVHLGSVSKAAPMLKKRLCFAFEMVGVKFASCICEVKLNCFMKSEFHVFQSCTIVKTMVSSAWSTLKYV